ncbi:Ank-repeat protein mbp1 [Apiospora rasikravindrae]|uniref:Ank-repeat protein mbp1 n=1 Tax=Apiospora rasikravindrae TaxID=990691 RepID=A0ABR1RPJ0_9PEZI
MDVTISSSMDEYQRDTDIVLWWLESTATSSGWKQPVDRDLTTKDLVEQADHIVDASIRLPQYAKGAFLSAIRLRERWQQWFEIGERSTAQQIEAHRHFIEVLKQCFSCFDDKGLHKQGPEDQMETPPDLSHIFAAMKVEDLISSSDDDRSQPGSSSREQASLTTTSTYLKRDPKLDAAFHVYNIFHDTHSARHEFRVLWTRVARGEISLLAASLTVMRYLQFIRELKAKVYENFCETHRSTGRSYQDMIGVLYNMMSPETGHITAYDNTLEQSETDRFVFLFVGEVLTKMKQIRHLTQTWSWPPPIPEAKLYKVTDLEFIVSDSFRELADIDRFLTQVCMDIYLVQLLGNDSSADMEARRLCLNPLQMALRRVWDTGVVTVESVFAAVVLLDFKELVTPPKPTLPPTQRVTFMDVKKRIYRDRSFYPFENLPSQQAEDREEFASGKVPRTMYHQYMQSRNLGHVAGTYAFIAETLDLIPMDGRSDFLYRVDPILLGTHTAIQVASGKPTRTALGDLLLRLQDNKIDFHVLMKELDKLAFHQGPDKKPRKSGKQKGKKKGKGKGKAKKKDKATKVRLTLPEGVTRYADSIERLCKDLAADA